MINRFIAWTILLFMVLHCAPKPFSWQGQHIRINTTEQPKEDFIAGDYIVIGYAPREYKKSATRLYKFALIKNNQQVGLITLDFHDFIIPVYFLEENGYKRDNQCHWVSKSGDHVTYSIYKTRPTYEQIKKDVIILIHGSELIPDIGDDE